MLSEMNRFEMYLYLKEYRHIRLTISVQQQAYSQAKRGLGGVIILFR